MLLLCFYGFSFGIGDFVERLSQIYSFFSLGQIIFTPWDVAWYSLVAVRSLHDIMVATYRPSRIRFIVSMFLGLSFNKYPRATCCGMNIVWFGMVCCGLTSNSVIFQLYTVTGQLSSSQNPDLLPGNQPWAARGLQAYRAYPDTGAPGRPKTP